MIWEGRNTVELEDKGLKSWDEFFGVHLVSMVEEEPILESYKTFTVSH